MDFTKDELLSFLHEAHQASGSTPKGRDFHKKGYPRQRYYIQAFGSWKQAIKEAGIERKLTLVEVSCCLCGTATTRTRAAFSKSRSGRWFCSQSCAAVFNNSAYPKRGTGEKTYCVSCGLLTKWQKFCSRRCDRDYRWKEKIAKIEAGDVQTRTTLRKFLTERDGYKCSRCARTVWEGEPIPLSLDHVDGNATNNHPENLRLLCHNCHALTPTFAGKNRGNGRQSRGIRRCDGYDRHIT